MKRVLTILGLGFVCGMTVLSSPAFSQDFDREACYRKCSRNPIPLAFRDGDAPAGARIAGSQESCFQDCERKFWEDFDRKEKGRKEDGG